MRNKLSALLLAGALSSLCAALAHPQAPKKVDPQITRLVTVLRASLQVSTIRTMAGLVEYNGLDRRIPDTFIVKCTDAEMSIAYYIPRSHEKHWTMEPRMERIARQSFPWQNFDFAYSEAAQKLVLIDKLAIRRTAGRKMTPNAVFAELRVEDDTLIDAIEQAGRELRQEALERDVQRLKDELRNPDGTRRSGAVQQPAPVPSAAPVIRNPRLIP